MEVGQIWLVPAGTPWKMYRTKTPWLFRVARVFSDAVDVKPLLPQPTALPPGQARWGRAWVEERAVRMA